jgi:tartrate-resistant acid phosphatase type 5
VVYLVNGLGGGSRYRLEEPVPGSRVRYNIEHGALLVEADTDELTMSFISVSEQLIDASTLLK